MRDFNEADKLKKSARIQIPENPANLSPESISGLEESVKASLKEGYLPCTAAWNIAKNANVTRVAVGDVTDHLAVRITDCQIGCFKVDKTAHDDQVPGSLDAEMITLLEALHESRRLTCAKVFDLAREFKLKPMAIADEANRRRIKVSECQLGCF